MEMNINPEAGAASYFIHVDAAIFTSVLPPSYVAFACFHTELTDDIHNTAYFDVSADELATG